LSSDGTLHHTKSQVATAGPAAHDAEQPTDGTGLIPSDGFDAATYIRSSIAQGQLKPGTRIPPERELAERLGTSRSSIREAIRELTSQGILVARQGAGTFVTNLDERNLFSSIEFAVQVNATSLMHMYELRRVIEPAAAAMAASRANEAQRAQLDRARATYVEAASVAQPDVVALIKADVEMHETIARSTSNPLVAGVLRGLRELGSYGRTLTSSSQASFQDGIDEVTAVVEAVIDGDALRAQTAMLMHLVRTEDRARVALEAAGSAGAPALPLPRDDVAG